MASETTGKWTVCSISCSGLQKNKTSKLRITVPLWRESVVPTMRKACPRHDVISCTYPSFLQHEVNPVPVGPCCPLRDESLRSPQCPGPHFWRRTSPGLPRFQSASVRAHGSWLIHREWHTGLQIRGGGVVRTNRSPSSAAHGLCALCKSQAVILGP